MKILSIKYTEESETLLFVHVQDETGKDLMVLPFYHKESDIEKERKLKDSIERLPTLLKQIYNSGLAQEEVDFEMKEVPL